ncbi:MAG: 2-dehydropantoate 2-reductase [Candidatus Paceibacterota bacterium]|jgi:2-dehydropantoate 2-reductase
MNKKIRVGVLGIGGVGGYFGGMLAQKYVSSDSVDIVFITKEATVAVIKDHGLMLLTSDGEFFVYPDFVTSDPDEVGTLDYLICAVKSYDLEESLLALQPCITDETVILPLLNGVDAKERIQMIYPSAQLLEGCVYIVAKIIAPATVQVIGSMHSLYFGSASVSLKKQNELAGILTAEGIDCSLFPNIEQLLWEKFIFVSPLATVTSYLNLPVGTILENEKHAALLRQLVTEAASIAEANSILLPNIFKITMTKIAALPYNATSSMHNDFLKGGKTEFQTLTEYVIISGLRLDVPTPGYDLIMSTYSQWKLGYQLK